MQKEAKMREYLDLRATRQYMYRKKRHELDVVPLFLAYQIGNIVRSTRDARDLRRYR